MKRTCIFFLALCLVGMAQAQVGLMRSSGVYSVQKASKDLGPLTKDGKIYYYHGNPMTETEMVSFIQQDCERAYQHYVKNRKMEIAGWSVFGSGAFMAVCLGSIFSGCAEIDKSIKKSMQTAAMSFYGVGAITGIVGLGVGIAGTVRKNKTHRVYNTWCGYKELEGATPETSQLELKLTSGANGLGLALSF